MTELFIKYFMINLIGTIAHMTVGKHGKKFMDGTKGKHILRQTGEIGLYMCISTIVWLPTLLVRMSKVKKCKTVKAHQA